MTIKGLMISAESASDNSAYSFRIRKLSECLADNGIETDHLYMADHLLLSTITTSSLCMLLQLGKLRNYDFICAGAEEAAHALFFTRPFLNVPIIYDIHGDPLAQSALDRQIRTGRNDAGPALRVRAVSWMAARSADHLITVSFAHLKEFADLGFPEERMSVLRMGVDLDLFAMQPFPERPKFTFGYAGEFQSWQGIDNLIEAFELLENHDARVLVIGFRKEDSVLKSKFAERFGPRVELIDRTDRKTLIELLGSVSILVIPRPDHPAIRHAFSTKFAEYAALGRPIMVNDVDETVDFIRKYDCGFISEPNPVAMAQVMNQAARLPRLQLAEMGRRARLMAEENFSWRRVGEDFAAIVKRVVRK
ncbi:MAG: glycosyltransferase [Desulfomonilaceae bacterium]|nr:glycosyltransferase [Desulfomonilaceae bacterium]